ncbi:hypothetical protein DVS77_01495 [Mycolicibacterium moriokaense]|nr:hypothetical protein DVS77_01495 [Mycolicibacterium moriokaense]
MRISTVTVVAAGLAAAIAVAPVAHAAPTVDQICAAQDWPRPLPDVVGQMFEPVGKQMPAGIGGGALACWDNIRGLTQDGQDASKEIGGWATITAVSPPPGTPVGRDDVITVHLAPMVYGAPPNFRPCDWVTTAEVAAIFAIPGPIETDGYMTPGSVNPHCTYSSPGHTAVTSTLYVPGAFPVDAAAEYSMYSGENATAVEGLGLAARCLTDLHGSQDRPYNQVVVLLEGNRLFTANGLGAQPCDQLNEFARTAIGRL